MVPDNLERSKVGGGTGPPLFTPFKELAHSSSSKTNRRVAETPPERQQKPTHPRFQPKSAERSRSQNESKSISSDSRDPQRPKSKPEEKLRSETTDQTRSRKGERGEIGIHSKQLHESRKGQTDHQSRERSGDTRERTHETQSSRYQPTFQGKRTATSSKGRDGGGESNEPQRSEESHYERGRRGRGRGSGGDRGRGRGRGRDHRDVDDDYRSPSIPSLNDRFQHRFVSEPQRSGEFHEPHHERGRRGRGRRGRRNHDDNYQPPSRPSTGHSLGDWFEEKLVLSNSSHSGRHYGGYVRDDQPPREWEARYWGRGEHRLCDYEGEERLQCSDVQPSTKEAQAEEYPPMPSKSLGGSQKQTNQGGGHWDWVGLAASSGAPSSARKQ